MYVLSEKLIREGVQLWGLINDEGREGNRSLGYRISSALTYCCSDQMTEENSYVCQKP